MWLKSCQTSKSYFPLFWQHDTFKCVIDKAGPDWNWSKLNSDTKKRAAGKTVCADCMCVGESVPCWEAVSRSQCDAAVMLRHSAGLQLHLFHGLNWSSTNSAVIQSHQDALLPTSSCNIISHTLLFHLLHPLQNRKPFKILFMLLAEHYAFWLHMPFFLPMQIKVQSIKVCSAFRHILFLNAMKVEQMLQIIWPKGFSNIFKANLRQHKKAL